MTLRCPACAATNPDSATWCNQCLRDLGLPDDPEVPPARRPRTAGPAPSGTSPASAAPTGADTDISAREATGAAFRRTDSDVEWRCPTCGGWSSMDDDACTQCLTPLRARLEAAAEPAAGPAAPTGVHTAGAHGRSPTRHGGLDVQRMRTRTVALNAVLPGLGHLLVGWVGSGLARILLFGVWVVGGLLLSSAGGVVAALPLFAGAGVLWLAGLFDGWQVVTGARQVLSGRALLWLVVGVTLLATVSVVASIVAGPV